MGHTKSRNSEKYHSKENNYPEDSGDTHDLKKENYEIGPKWNKIDENWTEILCGQYHCLLLINFSVCGMDR